MRLFAHLDLDAFFCSVEELEDPRLAEIPFIVGGDPHGRGIVATANYRARAFGIHSAMSAAEALRRCPELVVVHPTRGRYGSYSRKVWKLVRDRVPEVEQAGIDEGYLDLSACENMAAAETFCRALQQELMNELGLSASFGISALKVVAKIASDLRKPAGITSVSPGEEAAFLAPLSVRRLPGVGPKTLRILAADRIVTIGQLARLGDDELDYMLPGKQGRGLRERARGIDPRWLEAPSEPKQLSAEETFSVDLRDRARLRAELEPLARRVCERLVAHGYTARTVTLKRKYADFRVRSCSFSLPVASADPARIGQVADFLLDRALDAEPGALRLLGISCSRFERTVQPELPLDL